MIPRIVPYTLRKVYNGCVRTCRWEQRCRRKAEFSLRFWQLEGGRWSVSDPEGDPPYYCLEHALMKAETLEKWNKGEGVKV